MSETMKAVVVTEPGGPEVLELVDAPRPVPGPEEVLVRVAASGVNRADLMQREGRYPAPPGSPPDIPGLEYAGTVEAVGDTVRELRPGDPVMGLVGGGGYARYVTVHERTAVRVPRGTALADAGAVPEVFMTAWDALFAQVGLAAGETVLVHAVGSGVGTAALQLARSAGARVIGTSRTDDKLDQARALGLEDAVVGGDDGWPGRVLELTEGRGVDVVLDLVGAVYLEGNLRVLARRARWIVVGIPGGARGTVDFRRLMDRRATVSGTVLRARPLEEKIALARTFEDRVVPLFERGALRPVLERVYTPAEAGEAHRRMEANLNFGKLVLGWE